MASRREAAKSDRGPRDKRWRPIEPRRNPDCADETVTKTGPLTGLRIIVVQWDTSAAGHELRRALMGGTLLDRNTVPRCPHCRPAARLGLG